MRSFIAIHIQAPIKIAIYDDRIEIFSPGTFPGPLNTNNLKVGLTYIRNHAICKVFREGGYMEKLGSGFITLFESYEKWGLKIPIVIEGENFVKCILPREAAQTIEIDSIQKVIKLFDSTDELTISDVVEHLNISRATAGRKLSEMTAQGLINRIGKTKTVKYIKKK